MTRPLSFRLSEASATFERHYHRAMVRACLRMIRDHRAVGRDETYAIDQFREHWAARHGAPAEWRNAA
jgi:hypothetical protein